jgi:hypothetical protein
MKSIKYLIVACLLPFCLGSAKAAIVEFRLDAGVIGSGSSGFFGTVNIDTATGGIGGFSLSGTPDESQHSENVELEIFSGSNSFGYRVFNREFLGQLFSFTVTLEDLQPGYMGGPLSAVLDVRGATTDFVGTVTKVSLPTNMDPPAEVPLPAAFPLFLIALAALVSWGWRGRNVGPAC